MAKRYRNFKSKNSGNYSDEWGEVAESYEYRQKEKKKNKGGKEQRRSRREDKQLTSYRDFKDN